MRVTLKAKSIREVARYRGIVSAVAEICLCRCHYFRAEHSHKDMTNADAIPAVVKTQSKAYD